MLDFQNALGHAGFGLLAGADEAGRGACAGPLVAAAVILGDPIPGLNDSKRLTPARREKLFDQIIATATSYAIVAIEPGECDALGIQEADLQGLRRALLQLNPAPDFAITDGFFVDGLPFESTGLWKADQVAAPVAAASILAKVTRDRTMVAFAAQYPGYGFEKHKGYATPVHQLALETLGPCAIHRLSYDNVARTIRVTTP
jgi:ribonuclease HII